MHLEHRVQSAALVRPVLSELIAHSLSAAKIRTTITSQFSKMPMDELLVRLSDTAPSQKAHSLEAIERALELTNAIFARTDRKTNTCLYRSLTRFGLYRQCGYSPIFFMGINPTTEQGHAWVTVGDLLFDDDQSAAMTITYRYPPL